MEVIRSATSSASRTRALSHKESHAYWRLNEPPCWLSSSCWFSRGHLKLFAPSKFSKTYNLVKEKKKKNQYGFAEAFTNPQQNCLSSPCVETSLPSSQWLRFVSCLVFCHSVLFLACASIKILSLSLLECQMPKDILLPQRLHLKKKKRLHNLKTFSSEANTISSLFIKIYYFFLPC